MQAQEDLIFTPNDNDILQGRGNGSCNHPGNEKYIALIKKMKPRYTSTSLVKEKNVIVEDIFDIIKSWGARFIMKINTEPSYWVEMTKANAVKKIKQALRDALKKKTASESNDRKYNISTKSLNMASNWDSYVPDSVKSSGTVSPTVNESKESDQSKKKVASECHDRKYNISTKPLNMASNNCSYVPDSVKSSGTVSPKSTNASESNEQELPNQASDFKELLVLAHLAGETKRNSRHDGFFRSDSIESSCSLPSIPSSYSTLESFNHTPPATTISFPPNIGYAHNNNNKYQFNKDISVPSYEDHNSLLLARMTTKAPDQTFFIPNDNGILLGQGNGIQCHEGIIEYHRRVQENTNAWGNFLNPGLAMGQINQEKENRMCSPMPLAQFGRRHVQESTEIDKIKFLSCRPSIHDPSKASADSISKMFQEVFLKEYSR